MGSRESTDSSSAPVCDGHSQRGCRLSLSSPNEVVGSEWTLAQDVVDQLVHRWPATIDLFATSLNHRMPVYFAPMSDPASSGTDFSPMLEPSSGIRLSSFSADSSSNQQVLGINELRGYSGGSLVASTGVVPGSPATGSVPSGSLASASGSSPTAPLSLLPSQSAAATSSCVETLYLVP